MRSSHLTSHLLPLAVFALATCGSAASQAEEKRCARAEAAAISEPKSLPALAEKIASGEPLRIVALGSSSTEGTPDIAREAIYPAVMQRELERTLHRPVEVINKGKGGETIFNMSARMDRDVLAQHPDLVVWQLGANDVLQMDGVEAPIARMQEVLEEFGRRNLPVVLVDLQAAPLFDADKDTPVMQAAIEKAGRRSGVMHFHRQALMKKLVETQTADMPELVARDGLHMTSLAHFCTGQLLARQIARASLIRRAEGSAAR